MTQSSGKRRHHGSRTPVLQDAGRCELGLDRISATEADRQGIHADWPTWPVGKALAGDWQWLVHQVMQGRHPDVPCCWTDDYDLGPERVVLYWLDIVARTRHVVVGYGNRILTTPLNSIPARRRAYVH